MSAAAAPTDAERREQALAEYRKKLLKHKEVDTKVRSLRESVKELKKEYDKTEDDLKALQSVGQIIGEVLRQLDEERCELVFFFVCAALCCVCVRAAAVLRRLLLRALFGCSSDI
jgi:ATP-dependent 26S proteasome regulatory subunit